MLLRLAPDMSAQADDFTELLPGLAATCGEAPVHASEQQISR